MTWVIYAPTFRATILTLSSSNWIISIVGMAGLQEKVVLITGASSGIGATTAVEFAREGSKVSITGRNRENLEETAIKCRQAGCSSQNIFLSVGELTLEEDCKRIVGETLAYFGKLDILVNIAGGLKTFCFWNCPASEFIQHFNTNTLSMFLMCKYAMPNLYETKGVCINMGSLAALRPYNTLFPYTVAKAACNQLTRALSLEAGPKGVRVLSVDPGSIIDTRVWKRSGICPTEEQEKSHHERSRLNYPLLRLGHTLEVARVITWLASDHASFVTGVNFPVDGAISCMSQQMI